MKIIKFSDWFRWGLIVVLVVSMWLGWEFALYSLVTILVIDSELKTMINKLNKILDEQQASSWTKYGSLLMKQQKEFIDKQK